MAVLSGFLAANIKGSIVKERGILQSGKPTTETRFIPLYHRNLSTKEQEDNTMIYKLKQKLIANWKPALEMIFTTLLMAFLIALVTADFFNLAG